MLPRLLVFDLDGCTWYPEMYELWGGGGTPFKPRSVDGDLTDRGGNRIFIMADLRSILTEVKTDPKVGVLRASHKIFNSEVRIC
jgi:magnesium-dependent phosphatase 1